MSETPGRSERELHSLFQVLRDHVVEVVEGFGLRVNRRLQHAEERSREAAPSARDIAAGLLVQLLNLASGMIGAGGAPEPPGGDDES